jgi:protein-disulfide isomerase
MNTKKPRSNTLISLLVAAMPLMFIVGLFVGYQLWANPNVQADQAANAVAERYEIPIYDDDPVLGNPEAPVTIIEFSDYECPYCRSYHQETFGEILINYGDVVRYVFKDLPLSSIHPNAAPAANAAHCAQEQDAFWEFHGLLFSNQLGFGEESYLAYAQSISLDIDSFEDCLSEGRYLDIVNQDITILTRINAPLSTPTFFVNGQYLAGAQPYSEFARLIEAELEALN